MGRTEGYSLERRLLGRLLGLLLLLAAGLYAVVAAYAHGAAERAYDRLLLAAALAIADTVQVEDGRITVDLPYASLSILGSGRRDRVFYRIVGPGGATITGYPDLADNLPLRTDGTPTYRDAAYRGAPIRVAAVGRFVAGAERGGWTTIIVAETREERNALALEILTNAFLPFALAMLTAAGLIWFGVRRALAPLGFLERLVRGRQPHDLRPIDAPAPVEVTQLLLALNRFMERLQASLALMQGFLADAAHQIRTPLASLRAQAELAVEEDDPLELRAQVQKIQRNAALASQLTSQLLSHAMVTHRQEVVDPEAVDLAPLVRQVAQRAASGGEEVAIATDFRALQGPTLVAGDPVALREALANLVDNAVKYAGRAGPVTLRLEAPAQGSMLALEVLDRGPGIRDADKPLVLERFRRGTGSGQIIGSGLGLAIVKAVADAHGAALRLLDRPGGGLVVRLEFPRAVLSHPRSGSRGKVVAGVLLLASCCAGPPAAEAADPVIFAPPAGETARLVVRAATDLAAMEPLIRDFQLVEPAVTVEFAEFNTTDLYADVLATAAGGAADLAISSAADLQVKLVNDGFTQVYQSPATTRLPEWANWRDEAFGLTFEPAVMVYRRGFGPASQIPRSRQALIRLLAEAPDGWRRRIATYDIDRSGVGYLLATQDSVLSSQFWRLMNGLGSVQTRLVGTSAEMLEAVESGKVDLAYNVLGSYARAQLQAGAAIAIVLPEDYTLVLTRVAVIPRAASHPALAGRFLDYLLSDRGQKLAGSVGLEPILAADSGTPGATAERTGPIHPIPLGPGLLVFLDPLKKKRFLADWWAAMQPP